MKVIKKVTDKSSKGLAIAKHKKLTKNLPMKIEKSKNMKSLKTKALKLQNPKIHSMPAVKIIKKKKIVSNECDGKLPGVENFWKLDEEKTHIEPEIICKKLKKSRLTGAMQYQKFIDEEERIRKIEEELANPNAEPKTPDQFERKLLLDKNSSFLWIKYMAFYLDTAEVSKARSVAKKAIATINFREENEMLNVWMAYLNLEIKFGSMDSYQEILRESTQRNDSFQVYLRTLKILLESEKIEEANKIVDVLRKKFRPKPEMWLNVSEAYLLMKNERMAKEILPKSLLSLKEQEHVNFMVKYALMVSKHGLLEFSQTIFEKILSSYKKKLPIWFQYIDLTIKNKQIEIARSLYERLILVELPLKKMKTVFQKFIDFETKFEPANVSRVKKLAKNLLTQMKQERVEDDNE